MYNTQSSLLLNQHIGDDTPQDKFCVSASVSHCTNCSSLAYLAVLSVGGHITGLAAIPFYLLYAVPAKSF